jgi:hypothetical protein
MKEATEQARKELQILRSSVSQLSFINKEADKDLNEYLASSISSMRKKWASEWTNQQQEMSSYHKRLHVLTQEH